MALQKDAFQEDAFQAGITESNTAFQGFQADAFQIGAFTAATIVTVAVVRGPDGGAKKKKHRVAPWDINWQKNGEIPQPEEETKPAPEVVEFADAKESAQRTAQEIIQARREISRIRTQMRLSTNEAALQALQQEIVKVEKHLAKVKQDEEELLMITLLM